MKKIIKKLSKAQNVYEVRKILEKTSLKQLQEIVERIGINDSIMRYYKRKNFIMLLCNLYQKREEVQ